MLELNEVVKHYRSAGEEVRAVDGVSLRVRAGEMVALHGPSGSGKTTLLLLIAALLAPDSGSIRFQGRELSSLSDGQAADYLHRDVGFVYQSPQLMGRVSALENAALKLMLGGVPADEARARVLPWLERVGLAGSMHRPPERLSAGERQRVAIVRALAGGPRLVLADEPTGTLDSARSLEIIELLRSFAHEREAAVLLVTHDLEAASIADRSATLRDGRLTEGSVADDGRGHATPSEGSVADDARHETGSAPSARAKEGSGGD